VTGVSSSTSLAARLAPAAAGALLGAALPLAAWDAAIERSMLDALASTAPFESVFVVTVRTDTLTGPDCGAALDTLLRDRAKSVLLAPPLDSLCRPPDSLSWSEATSELLATTEAGEVVGLSSDEAGPALAVGRPGRVPAAALEDLRTEAVPPEVLRDKTVVVGAEDSHWSSTHSVGGERAPLAVAVAAAVGASDVGTRLSSLGRIGGALVAAALGLISSAVHSRFGTTASFLAWTATLAALHASQVLSIQYLGFTLPEASLALAVTAAFFVTNLTAQGGERARRAKTTDLVKRATIFRPQGPGDMHGDAVWQRLATMVAELYPTAGTAIYEVGPNGPGARRATVDVDSPDAVPSQLNLQLFQYDDPEVDIETLRSPLVLKPNGEAGLDEGGVLCPLDDGQSVLAHVLLLGEAAVKTHRRAPARTQALCEQLALLLQRALSDSEPRASRGSRRGDGALSSAARTAAEDRHALASMLDGLPVGLLYADSFGDVRMLGQTFREVLEQASVGFDAAEGGIVEPQQLSLRGVIAPLSQLSPQQVSERLSALWGESELVSFELMVGDQEPRRMLLQVGATRGAARDPRTYFGVLVDQTALYSRLEGSSEAVRLFRSRAADICMAIQGLALFQDETGLRESVPRIVARADELMDALTAFTPAVEGAPDKSNAPFSLLNVTRSASALLGTRPRGITLDAPVTVDAVRGPRSELLRSLHALLEHLTGEASESPVLITLREWRSDVELTVVDPVYGAPASILRDLDEQPERASSDEAPVGRLLELVRRTGGRASVLGDAGTGLTLTLRLRKQTPIDEEPADMDDETRAF